MIEVREEAPRLFGVWATGQKVGTIRGEQNPFHSNACCLHLQFDRFDVSISSDLFEALQSLIKMPLQVMTESDSDSLISMLEAGGFRCRRKCYERSFTRSDYTGFWPEAFSFQESCFPDPEHRQCCRLLYRQYADKHRAVSPLTADFSAFFQVLPHRVFYEKENGSLLHFAFIEENEVAYVGTTCPQSYTRFISEVAASVLEQYETICFESDDCDPEAMRLKSLFADNSSASFDTYIKDWKYAGATTREA